VQAIPEFRRSKRFGYEYIIKIEEDRALSPYYAVSCNLSETGMYFKSLFELYPGTHILIKLDGYALSQNQVPANVVWCQRLKDTDRFRYGAGVQFFQSEYNFSLEASPPIAPHVKTLNNNTGGVVIKMEKRLSH
jgi:hypothetical protein